MKYTKEINQIINGVAEKTGVSNNAILSSTREARVVHARHTIMWICRYYTGSKLQEIADILNCKRHATVIHGVKQMDNICSYDKRFAESIHQLAKSITQ